MPDPGKVKFKDGSTFTIDMSVYDDWDPEDLQTGIDAQISGMEKTHGASIFTQIPGYERNTPEGEEWAEGDKVIDIRSPLPPFPKSGIQMTEEKFKNTVGALPILGGFAGSLPGGKAPSAGLGILKGGLARLARAPTTAPGRAASGAGMGDIARQVVSAIHGVNPGEGKVAYKDHRLDGVVALGLPDAGQ